MTKGCLYCGLQLPATAEFCPRCGRLLEEALRVESAGKMRSINVATGCLYCGLQLPATAEFCPQCGRSIESGFAICPKQKSELDWLRKQMKGKDELLRQEAFSTDGSGPRAHREEYTRPGTCPECGAPLARPDPHTTGTFLTREFSSLQSNQPVRSRVRRVRAASAFRRRVRRRVSHIPFRCGQRR